MRFLKRKYRFYFLSFLKHDFRASITVFFVALPLCLGISLASNVPVYSGLIAGIIGGVLITLISKSELSVSGPAAGLTTISAAIIAQSGNPESFYLSVALAGVFQLVLGILKLGGFTHFIPSAVIKGMLAAIGVLLVSKQVPLLIGYDQPDFWTNEFFNIFTFNHGFEGIKNLFHHTSFASVLIAVLCFIILFVWRKKFSTLIPYMPASFITVLFGTMLAFLLKDIAPSLQLRSSQFVFVPEDIFSHIKFPAIDPLFHDASVWRNAGVICFVASLETLLSITAIDKLDPYNRITPQNRELVAQGCGNLFSGFLGGLPVTAVIVRSSANAEAGAKTRLSSFTHGILLLIVVLFALELINLIPYCVLAVILTRTGLNLAKPKMFHAVYRQGKEQFIPFIVTIVSILLTDLLIGVILGLIFAIYFLVKHTYRAGYTIKETADGHGKRFTIQLALNVSFLNKKRFSEMLDKIPAYSFVEINGTNSVYIDTDILEIFQDFKSKAHRKHIELRMTNIPEVETIVLH